MVKLILSDVDETLMPLGHKQVPDHVIEAFHAALDAGIEIGPASGRGFAWIPPFFGGDEACCATALATNGSQIYLHGELIHEEHLDHDGLERLRQIIAEIPNAGLLCFEGGTPLLIEGKLDDLAEVFPSYAETARPHPGSIPEFDIIKANVFVNTDDAGTRELVGRLNEEFPGFELDLPRVGFSNVLRHGWNKGSGVRVLAEALGIGLDEVVIFGDAGNDLPMFAVVEHSVAVANATPEAAAAARWHIGSCEEGAPSEAIQALARGEWPFTK